ncbi:MAG: hypothetical protein IRZ00_05610 [Gemmatimonadetes bacterium]|nr:hypothetical protein [Gemmatimonadota bacterium]
MSALGLVGLELRARRRRLLALVAFAAVFLAAAITGRVLATGEHGQVDVNTLFLVGGLPLASGLLVLGWILGRYPLVAVLVLMAGLVSYDRTEGYARVYAVRPTSLLRIYGLRFLTLGAAAFALSAVLMPTFDLIMLGGEWAGPATFVLILAYVIGYGGLVALLSVWTRGDAWIALLLALVSLVWNALSQAGMLAGAPPGTVELITFLLPPQAQFLRLEGAFADVKPIPWDAFAFIAGYGVVMLALAGLSLAGREV